MGHTNIHTRGPGDKARLSIAALVYFLLFGTWGAGGITHGYGHCWALLCTFAELVVWEKVCIGVLYKAHTATMALSSTASASVSTPHLQVLSVSSSCAASPHTLAISSVAQLPPRQSFSTCVSLQVR